MGFQQYPKKTWEKRPPGFLKHRETPLKPLMEKLLPAISLNNSKRVEHSGKKLSEWLGVLMIDTNLNVMHYSKRNPSKLPYILALFGPPKWVPFDDLCKNTPEIQGGAHLGKTHHQCWVLMLLFLLERQPKTQWRGIHTVDFWKMLLLIEEIHRSPVQVGSLSYYLQGFRYARWCRISEPSTAAPYFSHIINLQSVHYEFVNVSSYSKRTFKRSETGFAIIT